MLARSLRLRASKRHTNLPRHLRSIARFPSHSFHSQLPLSRQAAGKSLPHPVYVPKTNSSSPSGPLDPPEKKPIRQGWFVIVGLFAWSLSIYIVYNYKTYQRRRSSATESNVPLDVSDRFDVLAPEYDREVSTSEWLMRLDKRRKQLVQEANGHILEVSCGTGRNIKHFDLRDRGTAIVRNRRRKHDIESLTLVDKSRPMLDIARQKFAEEWPDFKRVRFVVADASSLTDLPPAPPAGYDTIVQTMGLCSTTDPVALLKCLAACCRKPTSDHEGGKILLLEHGRGYYDWLNRYLDESAPHHADRYGCWWNRDLGQILDQSGLEVVNVKRYHLGTTWAIELKPSRGEEKRAERPGK